MNSTPKSQTKNPTMDYSTLANYMTYLYPKNIGERFTYEHSLSLAQLTFFHKLNNNLNKSGSGQLSGQGSGFEPLPDDIHPPKTQKNHKNNKTKNSTTEEDTKTSNMKK